MSAFKSPVPFVSPYEQPPVFPAKNTHPRLLVTPKGLEKVRANLTHPDHKKAYELFLASAELPFVFTETFEFAENVLDSVADKALAYLLLGRKDLGEEAVRAILHILRHFYISPREDICRAYGFIMYTAARVYDWAFDLFTPDEREEIVSLCVYSLGPGFEMGVPPAGQGVVTGHGSEAQIFRDWLSLGIAAYDEHPDIYTYVAGRLAEEAVPPRAYYFRSGSHWQGSAYGPSRFAHELFCDLLFYKMTDETFHIFTTDMEKAAITFLCHLRADNEPFRDGDDFNDRSLSYMLWVYRSDAFVASALYNNPVLRDYSFTGEGLPISPAVFLLIDDPATGRKNYRDHLPKVRYAGPPRGQYVAHTKNGASVYFKVGESYSANHEWKDSGNFMIYYKGSLASAANCYEYTTASGKPCDYGSELDLKYNKSTVSSNCMLVYDPDEDVDPAWGNSGGQRADKLSNYENATLAEWMGRETFHWAKVLAHAHRTAADGSLDYCMLMGDHTNAYSDKVKDYRRTSVAIAGEDAAKPLLVFIYDRLVTRDPGAKKTWQMHTMGEYTVCGSHAVTTHPDGGVLVCDTLLPKAAQLAVVGSAEERFIVNGVNLAEKCDAVRQPCREDGRGRLTVSPSSPVGTEHFLHAMYVTEAGLSTGAAAELVEGEHYVAAKLFSNLVLFPTAEETTEITVDFGEGCTLYATNLAPGKWTDGRHAFVVESEERMLVTTGKGVRTFRRICE